MPIARVMNMPDGSTPVPAMGGGDQNGTLARCILHHQAGTGCLQLNLPRNLRIGGTTPTGIPGAVAPQNSSEPVMQASEGIEATDFDAGATTPDPPSGLGAQPNPLEGP